VLPSFLARNVGKHPFSCDASVRRQMNIWNWRRPLSGIEGLADHRSSPDRVRNRIPDNVRGQIIDLALELPELSPRELAVRFTDERIGRCPRSKERWSRRPQRL
jgi:hypothetical protein